MKKKCSISAVASALSLLSLYAPLATASDPGSGPEVLRRRPADSSFAEGLRFQKYVFGGSGSMSNVGSAIFEAGGGADWLVYGRLGVGLETALLGDQSSGVLTGGLNLSYHFLPERPGIEPFVVGGVSLGSPAGHGLYGYTWATAGGGFNYWLGNGMAFRFEVRGRVDINGGDNSVGLRLGVTF